MSHTRKTNKKELGILAKVTEHLEAFSDLMDSEINSTKDGSFIKSIKIPHKEKELKLISEKAKGFDEQLIPIENKTNQLLDNYSSLNADMQIACLTSLKSTLALYKEALERLLPKHKTVDSAPLDKVRAEIDKHYLNINKLIKDERELLDTLDAFEKRLRKGIEQINETRSNLIATEISKNSQALANFASRILNIQKSIEEKIPTVSVTSNAIWSKPVEKNNAAGDQLVQQKKPSSTKS